MLAYHITENVHNFGRPGYVHNEPIVDAYETLWNEGYVDRVHPDGYGKVRNVLFAMLESGLQDAERSYYRLLRRKGLVTLDLEACHDDDFIQGVWFPDELIIINFDRVRIVSRTLASPCTVCSFDPNIGERYLSYARYQNSHGQAVCTGCAPYGAKMLDLMTV